MVANSHSSVSPQTNAEAPADLVKISGSPIASEKDFSGKHPEVGNVLKGTRNALVSLAIGGAVALNAAPAAAEHSPLPEELRFEHKAYGNASGWVDVQSIKVAGGANFELPVKPEVKELWDFLAKNNREKDIDNYNALLPDNRKKVIDYFQAGKKEQKDERTLLKGVVPYLTLLGMLERGRKALDEYSKTGKLPKDTPLGYTRFVKMTNEAFPSAKNFIDEPTVLAIEEWINAIYRAEAAEIRAEAEQNKREAEQNKREADAAGARSEQNKREAEQNKREAERLKKLIEALSSH